MLLRSFLNLFSSTWHRAPVARRGGKSRWGTDQAAHVRAEALESRVVLYAASGNMWANPQLVTISFAPDGTNLGGATNDLNSVLNSRFGSSTTWQNQILKAAQTWAQQTNVNFAVVSDSGAGSGSGSYQQGDTGFGDIRIAGYNFGTSTLATAYMPPAINNYSIAGDIAFNSGQTFNIGTTYDLFTVSLHEFGHSLGLDHVTASTAVMYSAYNGLDSALNSDDINGIRNIYSSNLSRSKDAYDNTAANETFATATDVTSQIDTTSKTAMINNLDITTTADVDYIKFTAPSDALSTMKVNIQSSGLSLFAPKVWVYNSLQVQLATATGTGNQGSTLSTTVSGILPGQTYYIKVDGADNTAFGTGKYAVGLNFGLGADPVVTLPNTQVLNGTPLSGGGGIANGSGTHDEFLDFIPMITGISNDTGISGADGVTNDQTLLINGSAPSGATVEVFRNNTFIGSAIAARGKFTFDDTATQLADGSYRYTVRAIDGLGTVSEFATAFNVIVDTQGPTNNSAPSLSITTDSGTAGDSVTNSDRPQIVGTADANNSVTIYRDGTAVGTAAADSGGLWSFASSNLPDGQYVFRATVTDRAGNTSALSAAQSVTIDTKVARPSISGFSPDTGSNSSDGVTKANHLTFNGNADAGDAVDLYLDDVWVAATQAGSDGHWFLDSGNAAISDGAHQFKTVAHDVAGNVSVASSTTSITVDTHIGQPVIGGFRKVNSTLQANGVADPGSQVSIYLSGTLVGSTTATSSGTFEYTYSPSSLPSGQYVFSAKSTDAAGNVSESPLHRLFLGDASLAASMVDLAASSDDGSSNTDNRTSMTSLLLQGSATANYTVTLLDGSEVLGSVTADANSSWSFTTGALATGRHYFSIRLSDADGDIGLLSNVLVVDIR